MNDEDVGETLSSTTTELPTTTSSVPDPSPSSAAVTTSSSVLPSAVVPVQGDDIVVIIRTIILIVLLIFSLIGNSLIVLSVAQARSSRYIPFNAFILSMASYGLLECALTMSLATGFSVERIWKFGDFLAGFNASFVQLQNIGIILTILAMSIDRYVAVTRLTTYHAQTSVHRANYVVLYTWIHAFIFSLPLLFQNESLGIVCRPFVERCLCSLEEGTNAIFTYLLISLCFLLPIFLIFVFLCLVKYRVFKEKKRLEAMSSSEYSAYCMQESVLLKEARWCKYVVMLLLLYALLKLPYILIDVMTQMEYSFVFEPVTSGTATLTVDGSRFFYQTALSWLVFCFSALFPIITFLQFPDHWRNMKRYVTCRGGASVSNNLPLTRNQRQLLRQKQRRLRHRQKKANHEKRSKSNGTMKRRSPSVSTIVASNIKGEKIAVNSAMEGPEVMFRVPVLYPATDGLHLVASGNTQPTTSDSKKKKGEQQLEFTIGNTAASTANQLLVSPASCSTNVTQPSGDVAYDLRPSSVVDKRVDVTGSRDCLHSDDDVYVNSNSDADLEESESELNESANSRTLIWTNKKSRDVQSASLVKVRGRPPKTVWQSSPTNIEEGKKKSHHTRYHGSDANDFEDPPHPHTPSPPPDEETPPLSYSSQADYEDDSASINDHVKEKLSFSKRNLPSLKNQGIPLPLPPRPRKERLLDVEEQTSGGGFDNDGYETPPTCSSRNSDQSVIIKQSPPKLFPHRRVFISNDRPSRHYLNSSADATSSVKKSSCMNHKPSRPHVEERPEQTSYPLSHRDDQSPLPDIIPLRR